MNRTMWARSPASAQRNPTRRCFTHSLLTALIVYPLPVLTLCSPFSQQVLEIKFPSLKLSLTHSKTYFKLGNFGEEFKTELLFSVSTALYIVCENTLSLCSTRGEFLKCSFKVWSVLNFYLIKGHHKRGKNPPLQLLTNAGIKVEECRVWGAASWWPPTAATSPCSTINKERKPMRKGSDWKTEQEEGWAEFDVQFKQVISGKAKKRKKKRSQGFPVIVHDPSTSIFTINAL